MSNKKNIGRPVGRIKTAKIEISIDPKIKTKFMEIVHNEGITASGIIGIWIHDYINNKEREKK